MKNIIKHIVLTLVLITGWAAPLSARQDSLSAPATPAEVVPEYRYPDPSRLEEFRDDDDFQYLDEAAPGESLWDRFWDYVKRILNYLFGGQRGGYLDDFFRILIYAMALAVVGFAIYRIVMIRSGKIATGGEGNDIRSEVLAENIHELDFESLIQEAASNRNWRLAIRLRYLQTLKLLSDREYIQWEPYKTNHEYSFEIGTPPVRERFDRISYYFDYAWYGEFNVTESHYERVGALFHDMKRSQ